MLNSLFRRFRSDFWCDETGNERNWRAMNVADITALFEPNKTNGLNSIAAFEVFDFNEEIANDNNPIVTQEDIANLRNQLETEAKIILERALVRSRGEPETDSASFDEKMKLIAKTGLIVVAGGIVCVSTCMYAPALAGYVAANAPAAGTFIA